MEHNYVKTLQVGAHSMDQGYVVYLSQGANTYGFKTILLCRGFQPMVKRWSAYMYVVVERLCLNLE